MIAHGGNIVGVVRRQTSTHAVYAVSLAHTNVAGPVNGRFRGHLAYKHNATHRSYLIRANGTSRLSQRCGNRLVCAV